MKRIRGFTLSELIVVMAILAVLSALLFPVMAAALKRGYLIQDISQMRQVYVAIDLYDQDANDELPGSLLYAEPYAKSRKVFVSPVDPYRNGIPGLSDFPANMLMGANLRSPFRISYAYLVPMATYYGYDNAWIRDRRDEPDFGLLCMSMYNEPAYTILPPCQADIYRRQFTQYRINMDGSYSEGHVQAGESWTCSISGCFGYVGEFFPNPPYPSGCLEISQGS